MEPQGTSIVDQALETSGAGLEVGGAHWFAQAAGNDGDETAESDAHVVRQIKINVCCRTGYRLVHDHSCTHTANSPRVLQCHRVVASLDVFSCELAPGVLKLLL
jgi:hypothetical protein